MGWNKLDIQKSAGWLGFYTWLYGIPQVKKELSGARYSATKDGSSLDAIIETSSIGNFEVKIIKNLKGDYDLDQINYHPHINFFPKYDIYNSSSPITPAPSNSPFKYKITTKKKNTDIQIYTNQGTINGSVKVSIGPDKSEIYQAKTVTIYNSSGKVWHSFVPYQRKPKPSTMAPTSAPASTPSANPSP